MRKMTDVALDFINFPFITLTESKLGNHWYHDTLDEIFMLTARGFKLIKDGSKKELEKANLLQPKLSVT